MDLRLKDKVAFVAGGSKGIGRAVASLLAAEGCKVAIVARDRPAIENAVEQISHRGGTACGFCFDLGSERGPADAVEAVGTSLGEPDIVVAQASYAAFGRFMEIDPLEYGRLFDVLTGGVIRLARAVIPAMQRKRWGRFVHIGSLVAKEPERTIPHMAHNTVQSSVVTLLKGLSDEYAADGITFNAVGPGWCKTNAMLSYFDKVLGIPADAVDAALAAQQGIPAGRAAEPAEIAAVIAFLCSAQASYLTGEWIAVDGGKHRAAF